MSLGGLDDIAHRGKWLNRYRAERREQRRQERRLREAAAQYARAGLDAGISKKQIAGELGISRPTLDSWLASSNTVRGGGGRPSKGDEEPPRRGVTEKETS